MKKNIIIKLKKLDHNTAQKILESNKILIIKKQFSKKLVKQLIKFASNLGTNNFSEYHPISIGSPNHFRVNFNDPRSLVKGFFYQFNFFPWNQDQFNLYEVFKKIFIFKNRINNLEDFSFFEPKSNKDCTIRLSFQFYPKGKGFLTKHSDPVANHQKYLVQMTMSKRSLDYKTGGLFTIIKNQKIYLDQFSEIGDIVIFKADLPHGVDVIDKNKKYIDLDFKGRWMLLFSTNKLPLNNEVPDSIQL